MATVKKRRRRGYTRVSRKHQVTIPARALEEAGLSVGDELKVDVDPAGRILLSRVDEIATRRKAIRRTAGVLSGVYRPAELEKLRNEWR
ncbi:MAG: AbrB/MazE/SpoVT family DNA-binding domain-containing protein [Actinobacteria bacterium]|nr:MAG: AbrB/MazE/SpoVT family DNA-binding domain-containing protein [Actinomycetota bacterium]TMM30160.1 MAG: AbrB/MazE/SpoVT family DNA-binding domain-containing protein [Actinomycetota bacterium]